MKCDHNDKFGVAIVYEDGTRSIIYSCDCGKSISLSKFDKPLNPGVYTACKIAELENRLTREEV